MNVTDAYRPRHDLARRSYSVVQADTVFGREFVHDSLGRVVEARDSLRTRLERYGYDALGRLTSWRRYTASGSCAATDTTSETGSLCTLGTGKDSTFFSYDLAGNRSGVSGDSVEAGNRQRRHGGYQFDFDSAGNLVRKFLVADTLTFNQRLYWNSFQQLDSIRVYASGWQSVRYGYDAWGRRVRRTQGADTLYYVWNGNQVIAEYDDGGNLVRHYTYYDGTDRPHSVYIAADAARRYFVSDGRANVIGLVNNMGSMVATYRYRPFGDSVAAVSATTNPVRFAGREWDGTTGLYYNRARLYDPQVGRFISEDPVGLLGGSNFYVYAGNDPVNARDPSGSKCEWRTRPQEASMVAGSGDADMGTRNYLVCWDVVRYSSFGNPDWGGGASGGMWGILGARMVTLTDQRTPNRRCVGSARVLAGNTRLIGEQGAFRGVRVANRTAAVIPSQFGGRTTGQLRPYVGRISGTVGGRSLFTSVTDVIGGESPIPGMGVREALEELNPGVFIVEVVGSADLGRVTIELIVPEDLSCPTGTME